MMRGFSVALALPVVIGGIHCLPAGHLDDGRDEREAARATGSDAEPLSLDELRVALLDEARIHAFEVAEPAVNLAGTGEARVTSSAEALGSRFVAGTFSGRISISGIVLTSRGGDDVFLARIGHDGAIVWARAIGGPSAESAPRVTVDDDRITLIAMTKGEVDCGRGRLAAWSTETFFVCTFAGDGRPLSGASFPTGRP